MNTENIQRGGMKIIVKNDRGRDTTIRKIKEKRDFISIFSNTVRVEIVSVDSLTGFILRITLPADATPFRSDIFNERGELMNADEYRLPNTGQFVTEHILHLCTFKTPTFKYAIINNFLMFNPTRVIELKILNLLLERQHVRVTNLPKNIPLSHIYMMRQWHMEACLCVLMHTLLCYLI